MATRTEAGDQASPDVGPEEGEHSPGAPDADRWNRRLTDRTLVVVTAAVTLPFVWMGYGTDIDVANVLEAAERLREGSYMPSRPPGTPVVEALVAMLDPVGGHLLINLATAAVTVALIVGVARLVRAWGHTNGDLVAVALLASPVLIVAATSLADFVWALSFLVWGGLVHLRAVHLPGPLARLPAAVPAGALFGLAVGVRAATCFLVLAFLVADGWDRPHRLRAAQSGVVAGVVGVALFVPSWLAYDRSRAFLQNDDAGIRSLTSNLGLFLYKNYIFAGGLTLVVLAVAAPTLLRSLRNWGQDPLLRFAVLALLVSQGLFFQLPWKLAHLLPALLAALLWVAASEMGRRRRYLWVLVAALAVNGLVTFRPLAPDVAGDASTGSWNPAVTAGLLLNDIDCRATYMDEPPEPDVIGEAWSCSLRPLRGEHSPSD
jgi:hypothetical protein